MIRWLVQTSDAHPDLQQGVAPSGLLTPQEQRRLLDLRVAKRRHDWLLGRWTAKHLLQAVLLETRRLETPWDRFEIGNDEAGAPFARLVDPAKGAPLPVSLSISHSGDHAFCALFWRESGVCGKLDSADLGCDIERIEPREHSFVRAYFTGAESGAVNAAPASLRPLMVTALWSAKEAVLKAWRIGLRVDTRSVECDLGPTESIWQWTSAPRAARGSGWQPFSARVDGNLSCLARPDARVDGWWRTVDGYVMTLALRHSA